MPKVSVIIPTYNRAQYVTKAIDSVLAQTYKDYEIIVVDDGSTDNTREVLKPYIDKIHYIYQENAGVSAARNRGVAESRGEYLAFLDSDDVWHKQKIELQIPHVQASDIVGFHGVEWFVDEVRDRSRLAVCNHWPRVSSDGFIVDPVLDVAEGRYLQTGSLLCGKYSFMKVGLFDTDLCTGEDEDWFMRAAMKKMAFHYLKEPYLRIRCHAGQTKSQSEQEECVISLIRVFAKMMVRTEHIHPRAYVTASKRLASKISHLANIRALSGKKRDSILLSLDAFSVAPTRIRYLIKAIILALGWKANENRVFHHKCARRL